MAGTAVVNKIQLGDSATASQNFHLQTNVDGTLSLNRGNVGASLGQVFTVDSTGNILATNPNGVVGYGAGAGGTVTQATSKATTVTLNRPTGQIVMNNASLAAGASVVFQFNNSLMTANDILIVNQSVGNGGYDIRTLNVGNGACGIRVTNVSGAALADAVVITFAIIRGATS